MALTETRPDTHASPAAGGKEEGTVEGLIGTGDHKTIGRLFIGAGSVGLVGALVVGAVAMFYANDFDDLAPDAVDYLPQVWSLGRDLAIFGGLLPILIGLGVYLVPLQVGAPSLAFSRGAAAALWTWLLGTGLLILATVFNGGPGGGRRDFIVLWAAALAMMVGASLWALLCIAATILGARTQGMTLDRVPMTSWSYLVFALVSMFGLPVLMAELLMAFLRVRYFHIAITDTAQLTAVGDSINLAPAIYWLGIPILGMVVDIIGVHSDRPVRLHRSAMGAIGLFGVLTFGAHVVGLASVRPVDFDNGFLVVGLAVAVLPVLATLALAGDSVRLGTLVPRVPMVGALLSGLLLLLGTVVSLLGLVEPVMGFLDDRFPDSVDMTNSLVLNGTRFHEGIRALVVGAVLVGLIAALHHWAVKIWGRRLGDPLGYLAILATAGGATLFAIGEVAAGFDDQPWLPARVTDDFASGLGGLSLAGAAILAGGAVALLANLAISFLGSKPAGSAPTAWTGTTLEWASASPPVHGNFPGPPIVTSATPLADGELRYALVSPGDGTGGEAGGGGAADGDEGEENA
jgi:heme/copper-type cytochrome/quinol oxidase subunit 1